MADNKGKPQNTNTTDKLLTYLYTETWWQHSTCSSCNRIKLVREKEKRNSYPTHQVFISESLPRKRVGTDTNRIFMHTTGSHQGSRGESRIRQRTVDTQDLTNL